MTKNPMVQRALRLLVSLIVLSTGLTFSHSALAGPECEFGQGDPCSSSSECESNEAASLCAAEGSSEAHCEVPCDDGSGNPNSTLCSMGETCVAGVEPGLGGGDTYFCKASKFSMDLNLLDACVYHFLEGLAPDLSGANQCSLIDNLNQMLDQNADRSFNIYDVDLCVRAFLGEEGCDSSLESCPDGQVYCASDDDCGEGLFCDADLKKCSRECGYIVSRDGQSLAENIDRTCAGSMKTCDYNTGRCVEVEPETASCQVDQNCPSGAYCYLGQCAPRCYRSLDCPGSQWICSTANRCEPKPPLGSVGGFEPKDYSLQFAQREVALDPVQDSYEVPLLIMDLISRRQVFDQPNAVFGYRLELTYGPKQDEICLGDLSQLTNEQRDDCLIEPDEEFLTLGNPFGTIYGTGDPTVLVGVEPAKAGTLSPGTYVATLRAIFSNGNSTTTKIEYRAPSPSGEYQGLVSVYADGPDNYLGTTALGLRLFVTNQNTNWDQLLADNGVATEAEYENVTKGKIVRGFIHGETSMIFNQPLALTDQENEIPVVGLYSAETGRMRLIAVIDYPDAFCRSENGSCSGDEGEATVRNSFGRTTRRTMEFIGNFDAQRNRFEGVYREKHAGLAPYDFTLDGGFVVSQVVQDVTPIAESSVSPLLTVSGTRPFPGVSDLNDDIEQSIADHCPASVRNRFDGAANGDAQVEFATYLSEEFGQSDGPLFQDITSFNALMTTAIDTLNDGGANTALTLGEFMKGQIVPCQSPSDTECIDAAKLRCGLAVYQKAIVNNWIDLTAIGEGGVAVSSCSDDSDCAAGELCEAGSCRSGCEGDFGPDSDLCTTGEECVSGIREGDLDEDIPDVQVHYCLPRGVSAELFCSGDGIPGPQHNEDTCLFDVATEPTIVALQDHNRFYRQLTQALSFEAGASSREAFFTLFRAAKGDALDESSAYAHKGVKLGEALVSYDEIRESVFNPASTEVLFRWPMVHFQGRGLPWINQLHAMIQDRMETQIALVDHRRRVLKSGSQNDHMFAQHVLHQEYLQQVYLMALQRHWEGPTFRYSGRSGDLMALGDQLLAKSKDSRNPLGLHPNRIYFENSDLASQNWQNFRNRLQNEMVTLGDEVEVAVTSMKNSLADVQAFENSLLQEQQSLEAEIDAWCGSDAIAFPPECDLSLEGIQLEESCQGPGCLFEYECEGDACESVIRQFEDGAADTSCSLGAANHRIYNYQGGERSCFRGRIGALAQEKASLDLQRRQIVSNVQSLIRQIARQEAFIATSQSENEELNSFIRSNQSEIGTLQAGLTMASNLYENIEVGLRAAECTLGLSFDCPQKAAVLGVRAMAVQARQMAESGLTVSLQSVANIKENTLREDVQDRELRGMRMQLDNMVTEVENHIANYEAVTQQLYNVELQIADGVFQAQRLADRHTERLGQQVLHLEERLSGGASGDVLTTNASVVAVNRRFGDMLVEAYKMTRAFVHRFNLSSDAEAWSNRVYEIVTVDDLQDFIAYLNGIETNYCGAEGLDCDYINNGEVFEFSVQKQMFPQLRDIVNPSTGQVLTVGQQFHNIITSSGYVRRRARPYGLVEQIELPFAIWLNDRGENGSAPQRYMVGPGDCNHIIRGENANGGTIAVNVIGTRIPQSPGVKFELWRGNTDYIRSCTERSDTYESKINTYVVGWSPASTLGQLNTPPSFFTQSGELSACINNHLLGDPSTVDSQDGCFRFFARDRSLGAPDYTLVIPQLDRDQEWVLGDGLPANERPIIEDIVLYFRYNDRPITVQ